jgi:hypothetical protein
MQLLRLAALLLIAPATIAGAFLPALSLDVVSLTPAASTQLFGRTAITVTFNRAVIALGSDFGDADLPVDKVPFFIEVSSEGEGRSTAAVPIVAGRWRWVTTFVARFDPNADW